MWIRALADEARATRPEAARQAAFAASSLEVRMFSVGEGEAILVIFPGARAWLVDGGTGNSAATNGRLGRILLGYLERRGLMLEACLASHPHVDHAGALATILSSGSPALAPTITVYRGAVAWTGTAGWLKRYQQAISQLDPAVKEVPIDTHREVAIEDGVVAHLFAGSKDGPYTSLFMQLRFRSARLLFTGDSHCAYERELLNAFGGRLPRRHAQSHPPRQLKRHRDAGSASDQARVCDRFDGQRGWPPTRARHAGTAARTATETAGIRDAR